jgi:hypothetical protein
MKKLMSSWQWIRSGRVFPAVFLIFAFAGCDGNEVKVYKLAKDSSASKPQGDPAMPAMAANEMPAQPQLKWTLPEGWQEVAPGEMRVASFHIPGKDGKQADVSVIPLPGMAGGDLNNVNRWRGQVGLPPVKIEELAKLGEKVEAAGSEAILFDQGGTASGAKTRILATVLHREDAAWFFKMTGDDELVAEQKAAFIGFLKSLKFTKPFTAQELMSVPASETALPPDHPAIGGTVTPALPPDHPAIGGAMPGMQKPGESQSKAQWNVPPGWTEEPPTQMLLAKFSAGDPAARAEISVSSFPGDVGGLLANVNRWRRQVSLPAIDETQMTKAVQQLDVQSDKGTLLDVDGTDAKSGQPARLIGVAVPHGGQTWFFKMIGDAKVVAREKDSFTKFVQSVKFPNAL